MVPSRRQSHRTVTTGAPVLVATAVYGGVLSQSEEAQPPGVNAARRRWAGLSSVPAGTSTAISGTALLLGPTLALQAFQVRLT